VKASLQNLQTGESGELPNASLLGRSAECQIVIPDPRVSRRHAMIRKQDGAFYLFDLGSYNGSYLNGVRVTAARKLQPGDILNFADHEFRFVYNDAATTERPIDELGGSTIALIRSQPLIVLVSDVAGFTTLSERLPPDDLAQVIGAWYARCEEILGRRGATVDKFIGDCVLAYWTKVNPETVGAAVHAARELIDACSQIDTDKSDILQMAERNFHAGVGLHTGKVAYGGMSQGEFTLVGDPVNLTFRVEALTRELGHSVLLTEDVLLKMPSLRDHAKNLGTHQVKGRIKSVNIHALQSFPAEKETE